MSGAVSGALFSTVGLLLCLILTGWEIRDGRPGRATFWGVVAVFNLAALAYGLSGAS